MNSNHPETSSVLLPQHIIEYLRGEVRGLSDAEADLFFAVGSTLYRDERYAEAADMFRALVLGKPTSARAWASLAMCHDAVEDFERAAPLYEVAVRAPRDEGYRVRAQVYYARTLFWLERFDAAAAHLDALPDEIADDLVPVRAELVIELERATARRR